MKFHARDALQISGLSYKQLDHCLRSGILRPSGGGGHGYGSPRCFTQRDLVAIVLLSDVLRASIRVSAVAAALRYVQRGHGFPALTELGDAALMTDGTGVALVKGEPTSPWSSTRRITYLLDLGGAAAKVLAMTTQTATNTNLNP